MRQTPKRVSQILLKLPHAENNKNYYYIVLAHELDGLLQFTQQFDTQPVIHILDAEEVEGCSSNIAGDVLLMDFPSAVAALVRDAALEQEEVVVRSHTDVSFHQKN